MIKELLPHESFQIALKNATPFTNVANKVNSLPNINTDGKLPGKSNSNDLLVFFGGVLLIGATIYAVSYYTALKKKRKEIMKL
ncbi:MAG: hypothetical protein WCL56_12500 [Sediminibacterium sp.]